MRHRTQILLDPPQYQFLKSLSYKKKIGIGELIRNFIDEKIPPQLQKNKKDPLENLIGSCVDEQCHSENFKTYLYGDKK